MVAGLITTIVLVVACGGGNGDNAEGIEIATVTPSAGGVPAVVAGDALAPTPSPSPTPEPPAAGTGALSGFIYPIPGGCLPSGDQLMPNAPREYRLGTHEGVDFYEVDNCTPIGPSTPAVAVRAGRIIRIDHDYVDPTPAEMSALLGNPNNEEALDQFRGRQVWIDHGEGIVTRYCHLGSVASGLQIGDMVSQGTTVGFVGESGTPESMRNPGSAYHLHWEVRVGDSYLGAGMEPAQVRAMYLLLFNP